MWPISRSRGPPAVPANVPTTVSPSAPSGSGRIVDVGAELRQERGRSSAPTSFDAGLRVAPAVDVDEALEVGEERRQVGARSSSRSASSSAVGGASRASRSSSEASLRRRRGLLSCPDRATGRDPPARGTRTSTGSSRWSRSRSPSGGGGPGTASATRSDTPWSGSGRDVPAQRLAGPRRRARRPGSAACAADHGEGRGGLGGPPLVRSRPLDRRPSRGVGAERARTIAEAALALAERDVSPSRTRAPDRSPGAAPGALDASASPRRARRRRAWIRDADRRDPGRLDLRHQRQEHRDPAHHPHPAAGRARTSARPPRTASSSTSGWSSAGDWTGPGRRPADPRPDATSTSRCSRRPAAGSCCAASATSRTTRACSPTSRPTTSTCRASTPSPSWPRSSPTICRITKPDGWVVLNGDDPLVAAVAPRVRAHVAFFSMDAGRRRPARVRRHAAGGGRAYVLRRRLARRGRTATVRRRDRRRRRDVPITIGGLARHNVANALAAAGRRARLWARRSSRSRDGLLDFRPSTERSPGRLNLFRLGLAARDRRLRPQRGRASRPCSTSPRASPAGAAGRAAPITAIIGTAGDRPDDTLRGIGRIAAQRAQRVAIKETRQYLRGRTAASVVGELLAGVTAGGVDRADVPVYETETEALRAELNGRRSGRNGGRPTRRGSSC